MTSASELFCNRRSRLWRNPESEITSSSSSPSWSPFHRYHRHYRNHHPDLDDCDPSHRTHQARQVFHRISHIDCDSGRNEDPTMFSHTSTSSSSRTLGYLTNRMRVDRGERLPGSVLQARARLLERLRGTSVAGSRQRNHSQDVSGSSYHPATSDYLMLIESGGDWETESQLEWMASMNLYGSSRSVTESWGFSTETNKKPPGLSRDAIDDLQIEVFKASEEGIYVDCSICLERFVVGEGLARLPCGHRFHPSCLDPWITTCGDCPYCRAQIEVDSGL